MCLAVRIRPLRVSALYLPSTGRSGPVPLRGTFDGADVLSLELVVLLQGAGTLLELGVFLLQAVQGLLELLVLRRCVLGREEPGVSGGT